MATHAGVHSFAPTEGTATGVWFVGHGSFNLRRTPKTQQVHNPGWLAGGVKFWCHDNETLKAVVAEMIIDDQKLASIPGLIKAAYRRNMARTPTLQFCRRLTAATTYGCTD